MVTTSLHKLNLKPSTTPTNTIKFLCSYGGKILPRHPDGKLRYHGGHTRVLAVDRSVSFSDLSLKLGELMSGTPSSSSPSSSSVCFRCQLPTEDLDALVSITSDEDLVNLLEEYDRVSPPPSSLKIRAFLSLPRIFKPISPPTYPSSPAASSNSSSSSSTNHFTTSPSSTPRYSAAACLRPMVQSERKIVNPQHHNNHAYCVHGNPTNNFYLVHNGNHWQ
ncbi:hypothetical protein ACFE04_022685 [Oxalis oulophora]